MAELHRLLEDPATREEASEAIRQLIDKVVLTPIAGKLQIDLHGELAAILGLCKDSKMPATEIRDGLEQVKMVAAAGFEPGFARSSWLTSVHWTAAPAPSLQVMRQFFDDFGVLSDFKALNLLSFNMMILL